MAASQNTAARSLPSGIYSPLNSTSMSLRAQSSLNSALTNASMAAEGNRVQKEEEEEAGRAAEFERLDEEEEEDLKPALLRENGPKRRANRALNGLNGDLMGGGLQSLTSRLSNMSSLPLEELFEDEEMASTSDSEPFEASELELIEAALRSLRSVEEDGEVSRALEHGLRSSSDLQDLEGVSRLLKKVQAVKARKREAPEKHMTPIQSGSLRRGPSGEEENIDSGDIRQVVQAAAQTALAAAKTAETVVSSLNRNSQAMEELCKALALGHSLPHHHNPSASDAEEDEEDTQNLLAIELKQTEITKSLVRQNRITHWVLGFIVVTSFVWRYGVVKFVKQVNNSIQNPFQGFTDMLSGQKEKAEKEYNLPHIRIPGILDDEDERKRLVEEEKDDNGFDLGSFFAGLNGEDEAERRKAERLRQKKAEEGTQFNLGNFFSGLSGEEEEQKQELKKQKQKQKAKAKAKMEEEKEKEKKDRNSFNFGNFFKIRMDGEDANRQEEPSREKSEEQRKKSSK